MTNSYQYMVSITPPLWLSFPIWKGKITSRSGILTFRTYYGLSEESVQKKVDKWFDRKNYKSYSREAPSEW